LELLYKKLSYDLQGAFIEIRKQYGPGHKEVVYQRALTDELRYRNIKFINQPKIKVYSHRTNKVISYYQPDLLVDDKIIVEIKALKFVLPQSINQLFDYLKNSDYELGYFVNFSGEKLLMKRIIYTNNHKPRFRFRVI